MSAPVYVYLCYGDSPSAERELRYSLQTLVAELKPAIGSPSPLVGWGGGLSVKRRSAAAPPSLSLPHKGGGDRGLQRFSEIVIYTDRPAAFADLGAELVDASGLLAQAFAHPYRHRIKPIVLADALRRFARPCAMLDLDSFVRPGFAEAVARALAQGAAMNQFVRRDPYPDFPDFEAELPHLGRYRLSPQALMLNSGLIVVDPAHLPLVDDALALIDRLWAGGLHRHDVEQFALAETLRLGGVKIALIDRAFEHYCARWARRYMRRRLRRRRAGEPAPYSRGRVRLFKAYWTLRLAMRNARQLTRTRWRKT